MFKDIGIMLCGQRLCSPLCWNDWYFEMSFSHNYPFFTSKPQPKINSSSSHNGCRFCTRSFPRWKTRPWWHQTWFRRIIRPSPPFLSHLLEAHRGVWRAPILWCGTGRCGPCRGCGSPAHRRSGWSSCGGSLGTATTRSGSPRAPVQPGGCSSPARLQGTEGRTSAVINGAWCSYRTHVPEGTFRE